MTIGPAPMISMLSISLRLGISAHQRDEAFEQVMAVLRTRARLGVVLNRENRLVEHPQAFIGLVEEREMGRHDEWRQTLGVHDKAVVLTGNLDLAGTQILHRVVCTAVPARHLEGPATERDREQLVAEANAEYRLAGSQQVAQHRHGVSPGRGGVSGSVRQKNTIGTMT